MCGRPQKAACHVDLLPQRQQPKVPGSLQTWKSHVGPILRSAISNLQSCSFVFICKLKFFCAGLTTVGTLTSEKIPKISFDFSMCYLLLNLCFSQVAKT